MNINTANQHQGILAWTALAGPVNRAIDIRRHVHFGFTFQVDTDITADAVFEVRAMPPLPPDNCEGDVANAWDVPEVPNCSGAIGGPKSTITIPVGTTAGTVCTATLPCKPGPFVQVFAVSGDTGRVTVVATLSGPR
jgi:hypothetical protein